MKEHVSIKKTAALPEGLDFDALRLRGIDYAQELSGAIWTDYNEHDPGVTLLEHLCFTLTDLAYRANFDIKDILYASGEKGLPEINNAFFAAVDILPTTPVSPTDYRRLLIDRIRVIRNAWVLPVQNNPHGYKGLFRIHLQLAEDIDPNLSREKVVSQVRDLIMEHRNLCEDLDDIIVLKTEFLQLSASISIEADAFGEKVLANLLHTVEQLLNPGIRYYTREELMAEGHDVEKIFDGPEPFHGFIKAEDLRPLPENTHVSVLREAMSKVRGVKMVDDLSVRKDGQRIIGDEILPSLNCSLSLDKDLVNNDGREGSIRLFRNGVPVSINPRQTRQFHNTLTVKAKKGFQLKLDLSSPRIISQKTAKNLSSYQSFQRLMPAIYGIGANGLPPTANRERRVKAHQLKAYLLFFEQFMADYLAQLANVRTLFSINPEIEPQHGAEGEQEEHVPTYFTQFPGDIPNIHRLYQHHHPSNTPKETINKTIEEDLQKLSAAFDPADERRNRFLNHLLARFGEVYSGDFLDIITTGSREELAHQLIKGKAAFLRKYPELSRNRGKAFNYVKDAWENENVSGLKKRIALLLNINEYHEEDNGKRIIKYQNRPLSLTSALKGIGPLSKGNAPNGNGVKLPFLTMLRKGCNVANYDIVEADEDHELHFLNKGADAGAKEEQVQGKLLFSGSKPECTDALNSLVERFQKINATSEGFFFLENILLRPKGSPGSVLVMEAPLSGGVQPLRSPFFTDEKTLHDVSIEILILATRPTNWQVLLIDDGWYVVLAKEQSPILVSDRLNSEEDAKIAKNGLIPFCTKLWQEDPASIENYLRLETERFAGYAINSNFYSLRLSIVAPGWPAMFQEQDFRQLFHQVVAMNVPAHLSVDYYWLEPAEMTKFESTFKNWLEAMKAGEDESSKRFSLDLIDLLYPDERAMPSAGLEKDEEKVHQKLSKTVLTGLGQAFGYGWVFSPQDFSFFSGLSPAMVTLLPSLDITDWRSLKLADPVTLVTALQKERLAVTEADVRHWKRQATMARANRWKDLLRYQRKALTTDATTPYPAIETTKVERAVQALLQRPADLLNSIQKWVERQPAKEILPYSLLSFLIEGAGYGLILPEEDLRIFSCIDEDHEKALNKLGINNWKELATIKTRDWKSILLELGTTNSAPSASALKQEVALALAGDWETLISEQQSAVAGKPATAIEQRITYYLEQLMSPPASDERLLVNRLKEWNRNNKPFNCPPDKMETLLETLPYQDILSSKDFQIFEGIGKKSEEALRKAGITNWNLLASAEADKLKKMLAGKLAPGSLSKAASWIEQAKLADADQWSELIEWQKGPLPTVADTDESLTALEKSIQDWMAINAHNAENILPDE